MITASPVRAATARAVARLVALDRGLYSLRRLDKPGRVGGHSHSAGVELALPAIQVCAPPGGERALAVRDGFGRARNWLSARHTILFVTAAAGGAALITAYRSLDRDDAPARLELRRLDPPGPAVVLSLGGEVSEVAAGDEIGLEIVAHIRTRGDLRFVDAPWIGRLGAGQWIEAFTVLPRDRAAAASIEYKGLTASGAETPWLASGAACGTTGQGQPLIGFALRQRAVPGEVRLDCEYVGYFASGTTAGPARNGAPCRSARDNDPLEGMQLRITRRAR